MNDTPKRKWKQLTLSRGDEVEDAAIIEGAKVEVKAPEGHLRAAQSPEESLTSPPRLVEINKDSEGGVMRDRLKQLKAPIYGTKSELWARIVEYEGEGQKYEMDQRPKRQKLQKEKMTALLKVRIIEEYE